MLTPAQLLQLARAYGEAEGVALSTVGARACGNNKVLRRIAAGRGVTVSSALALETFFRTNWPPGVPWPDEIPARRHCDDAVNGGARRSPSQGRG